MSAKMDLTKYAALETAKANLEALLARHAEELAEAEAAVSKEQLALGLGPYMPTGRKRQPKMASAKKQYHDDIRAEAIKNGWFRTDGRKKGQPDVERVRLERKVKELKRQGITKTVDQLVKEEIAERAERAAKRLKGLKKHRS